MVGLARVHTFLAGVRRGAPFRAAVGGIAIATIGLGASAIAAEERIPMPLGALVCKTIEPTIEHARIVKQPTTAGLREFVEAQTKSGACRVITSEVTVAVVDVDPRGFALVTEDGGQGWTDAENIWGYFDASAKVRAWKRR